MLTNRSIPDCTVIPVLSYPDVVAAAAWLGEAFGFTTRFSMGTHRIKMRVGDGRCRSCGLRWCVRLTQYWDRFP